MTSARARRRLAPTERRRELLDALAMELTVTDFHRISVPAVVQRADASQGLFYRYFGDLDDAFVALLDERIVPHLVKATTRLRLDHGRAADVEDELVAWFEHFASLIESQGAVMRAALLAAPSGSGKAATYCRDLIEQLRQWGEDLLETVNGRPPFRRVDSHHVSHMVVGMIVHCALHGLKGVDPRRWALEMGRFETWGLLGCPGEAER